MRYLIATLLCLILLIGEADAKKPRRVFVDETSGKAVRVDADGSLSSVQHANPNNGHILFDATITAGTTQNFLLLDISDTVNFPHVLTEYVHADYANITIDAEALAEYNIEIGFLENVDGTDGDFHCVLVLSGDKKAGNQKSISVNNFPNGPRLRSISTATSVKSLNDTAFQTDVNLATLLDPTTADTPSGNGDLIMRVVTASGDIDLSITLAYHTH